MLVPSANALLPPRFRGRFRFDDDARAVYSEAAGIARVWPRAVAAPEDAADLVALVEWAADSRTPLVPRGSGSSMPNGAVGDGVVVDLSRWRTIHPVEVAERTVRAAPGALRDEIDSTAKKCGLRFPVDPSSGAFCTIGGMASTNAAGSHSMRFGAMRQWVRAIDCVFADGSRVEVRRGVQPAAGNAIIDRFLAIADQIVANGTVPPPHAGVLKDSSGYGLAAYTRSLDLVDLLVGSEGTLAFFVELELALLPAATATSSVLGAFKSIDAAVAAAVLVRQSGAVACELLDRTFLDVAASGGATRPLPVDTESALLVEVEGVLAEDAARSAREVARMFESAGASTVKIALDPATEADLWELRHAASPILARLDPRLRSMQFIEDCAVPPEHLAEYVRGVREILAANETRGVIFGHAGDAHVHVNPLVDVSHREWRARVDRIFDGVTNLAARLGGTLTGEHGDGRLRTPILDRVWPPDALDRFALVKNAFDPLGILNPGVKVPLADQRSFGEIKYDPALAPLPHRARAALDRVEQRRAYSSFRLDLLAETL